jgi:hypothetical protein
MLSIYMHLAAFSPLRHMQRFTFPGQRFPPCRSRLPAHTPMRRPAKTKEGCDIVWQSDVQICTIFLFFSPLYKDNPFTPILNNYWPHFGAQYAPIKGASVAEALDDNRILPILPTIITMSPPLIIGSTTRHYHHYYSSSDSHYILSLLYQHYFNRYYHSLLPWVSWSSHCHVHYHDSITIVA